MSIDYHHKLSESLRATVNLRSFTYEFRKPKRKILTSTSSAILGQNAEIHLLQREKQAPFS